MKAVFDDLLWGKEEAIDSRALFDLLRGSRGQIPYTKIKVDLETLHPSLLGCEAALDPQVMEDSHKSHGQDCKPTTSLTVTPDCFPTIVLQKGFL